MFRHHHRHPHPRFSADRPGFPCPPHDDTEDDFAAGPRGWGPRGRGPWGPPGPRGFGPPGRPGGPGGRARRGEARLIILGVLSDGPRHGYEVIKLLEERSGGAYAPSPGTVYPTLQFLEEAGHIQSETDGSRRSYSLTEAGREELAAHQNEVDSFWARFGTEDVGDDVQHELRFLHEEFGELGRTLWNGAQALARRGPSEKIRALRQVLERCKNEVRDVLTSTDS